MLYHALYKTGRSEAMKRKYARQMVELRGVLLG